MILVYFNFTCIDMALILFQFTFLKMIYSILNLDWNKK